MRISLASNHVKLIYSTKYEVARVTYVQGVVPSRCLVPSLLTSLWDVSVWSGVPVIGSFAPGFEPLKLGVLYKPEVHQGYIRENNVEQKDP